MAIDTTRGLPSFSEMYGAFKQRGSLADIINAGVTGAEEGYKTVKAGQKSSAETEEAKQHAAYYKSQAAGGGQKKVSLAAMDDKARAALQPYADAQGNVDESTAKIYLATTAQGQAADKATSTLEQRQREMEAQAKHQSEVADLQRQLNETRATLGAQGQANDAAKTVANVTSKDEPPSVLEKYVGSPIKKAVTGTDTAAVISERQKQAALQKLSQTGGINPAPQVTPSEQTLLAPAPMPAPRSMKNPGKPVPVYTEEDYNALAPGQAYLDASGKVKVKGK